jgi:phage baseplate assembly protein W
MSQRQNKFTVESKKLEYYSDFMMNLEKNPLTGFISRLTNEDSIKQSLKNLILTNRTERPFQPWLGSKIQSLLFEPDDPMTRMVLEEEIKTTIDNCEPRVLLEAVNISGGDDDNSYYVRIDFSIANIPEETFNLEIILRRVR